MGLWMGLDVPRVMLLCIAGNMMPIPLILCALRSAAVKKLLGPVLRRAASKTAAIGAHDRWVGVAAFVGVPLPGTGAWTGATVAYLLGMDLRGAVSSVLAGVCVAACVMASLTLAGWYGCAVAAVLCTVALFSRSFSGALRHGKAEGGTVAEDAAAVSDKQSSGGSGEAEGADAEKGTAAPEKS